MQIVLIAAAGAAGVALAVWLFQGGKKSKRAALESLRAFPDLHLKELTAEAQIGWLRLRARTEDPVVAPWSEDEVVAVSVTVSGSAPVGHTTPRPRVPRILVEHVASPNRWRTKRGTAISFVGDVRIARYRAGGKGRRDWDRLPPRVMDLLADADVSKGAFSNLRVIEHPVCDGDWVLVLGSFVRTNDGFRVKRAKPAGAIFVYVGTREELHGDLENINPTMEPTTEDSPALLQLFIEFHAE